MNDVCMGCKGLEFDRWHIPPFVLEAGTAVSLLVPSELSRENATLEALYAVLTGVKKVDALTLAGPVCHAKPARPPWGWRRLFRDPTPFDWLKRNTRLSGEQIRRFLLEHKMEYDIPISRYAGTPRTLLG